MGVFLYYYNIVLQYSIIQFSNTTRYGQGEDSV